MANRTSRAREAAEQPDGARAAWVSLLRHLRSMLDEVAGSYGVEYSPDKESSYQDLRRHLLRGVEGAPVMLDDAARIYPEFLTAVAGHCFERTQWLDSGRQQAIRLENSIDDLFAKKPVDAAGGTAASTGDEQHPIDGADTPASSATAAKITRGPGSHRIRADDRRSRARALADQGVTRKEITHHLGVTERYVYILLAARPVGKELP